MATVNFYPRTKKGSLKDGSSKIQVRVSIGRNHNFLVSTKYSVPNVETDWDFEKKTARNSKLKKCLETIKTKFKNLITDTELDLSKSVSDLTSDDFRRIVYEIHRTPEKERTFARTSNNSLESYIDIFIDKCRKKGYRTKGNQLRQYTEGTLAKYKQLKETIMLFGKEEGGKINLNSFDSKTVDLFESFLTEQYAVSTAGRKLKTLKTVLGSASKEGEEVDPYFRSIKGYTYNSTVVPLTEDEQELIFSTPMPNNLMEYAKDWLLILCGTGQRFSDVHAMTKENIKDGVITITQKKTGNKAEIPIFDRVQRILDKYDGFPPKFSDNEGSQNAHLNKMVKEVCKECKINEKLKETKNGKPGEYFKYDLITTKTGRKSLATYLYKELRWDEQSCMSITGHLSVENFHIYVGGKNSAITEANKRRVSEINKMTIEKRTKTMKII